MKSEPTFNSLEGKIKLDVAYYNSRTVNQILPFADS